MDYNDWLYILVKVDIRVRVKGGGTTSQIYAIRQAIAKAIVAYYQKCKCLDDYVFIFFDIFIRIRCWWGF